MKGIRLSKFFFLLNLGFYSFSYCQTASCVHGGGIQFLLDAYLASIGACNCEKSPVLLYSFPECNNNLYELEFEDNFDGSVLDTTKWEIQPYAQGTLKNSSTLEYNSLENASVSNGICSLTAKKETVVRRAVNYYGDNEILADGLPNLRTYDYTSSNIWTKTKFFHGKYEIKCRMPKGNGFWPAFWMFGGKRWNEIDVFDNYAGINHFVTSIGHDFDGTGKSNGCNEKYSGYDFSQWHTFTCIFDFDKIAILIDGNVVRITNRILTVSGQPIVCGDKIDAGTYFQLKSFPIEKMSIILNLALISDNGSGGFVPIDGSTPFPSSFEIDYVRMWKRSSEEETVSVLPNPTTGLINLKSNSEISAIKIYTTVGKIVFKSEKFDTSSSIDLSTEPDGIYLLNVKLNNTTKTLKVMKIGN